MGPVCSQWCKVPGVKVFIPQGTLEEWAVEEKADLKDGKLVIPQEPQPYPTVAAVHFVKCVSGSDTHKLLAKVKTEDQLKALNAEQMADSVVLGETAYEVVPGYVAQVPSPAKPVDPKKKASPEADLLAAFILDKMS